MSKRKDQFSAFLGGDGTKKAENNTIAVAKKIIDEQKAMIDGLLNPRVSLPKVKRALNDGESWCRVVYGDLHGSAMDQDAVSALLNDLEIIRPREQVNLGDLVDCGGFLAAHHVMGYVAQTDYSYAEDIHMAATFLDRALPHSETYHYLMGNHERRPEQWVVGLALKQPGDRDWIMDKMMDAVSVESLLQLDARGINYVKQGQTASGQFVPATIRLGKSIYTHTAHEGGTDGLKHLKIFQTNVAFGHTHTAGIWTMREAGDGQTLIARNYGCLCKLQPMWTHTRPTSWNHGYGLEICRPDGRFTAIWVPILNGESMLSDFAGMVNL